MSKYIKENPGQKRYRFLMEKRFLNGEELARKEMGDDLHVKVTCAHLEIQDDADLDRFAKLGVFANFTPHWHAGDPRISATWLGEERSRKQFRCKTLWTAAIPGFYDIEVKYVGADAQINPARGVVVTNAQLTPTSAEIAKAGAEFFGPDSRHAYDYMYYYNNIKDNAAKRVTAYLNNRT